MRPLFVTDMHLPLYSTLLVKGHAINDTKDIMTRDGAFASHMTSHVPFYLIQKKKKKSRLDMVSDGDIGRIISVF